MQCPTCNSDAPPAPSICPHCGAFLNLVPGSSTRTRSALSIMRIFLAIVALLMVAGVAAFNLIKKSGGWRGLLDLTGPHTHRTLLAIVHGGVAQPSELHGKGALYFIPMGRQAIPAQSLAAYYEKKFAITVTVLPEVRLDPSACIPARKQCVAEEMILATKRAYPKIASDPGSVVIILTDEDLYGRSLG